MKLTFDHDGLIYRGNEAEPYNNIDHKDEIAEVKDASGKTKVVSSDNPDEQHL